MFSGIVEVTTPVLRATSLKDAARIIVARPGSFNDLTIGDSIATNGVCLTVEKFDDREIQFSLGAETLKVTGWSADILLDQSLNLERSLRLGDRIHGHLVSGHVDTTATVNFIEKGESWIVSVRIKNLDRRYVWAKGSITLNGVSLTVNALTDEVLEVCLIPETLSRTNLKNLVPSQVLNVEYDYWAKAFVNYQEHKKEATP